MSPIIRGALETKADSLLTRGKVFRSARLYRRLHNEAPPVDLLIERGNEFLRKGDIDAATEAFVCAGFAAAETKKLT